MSDRPEGPKVLVCGGRFYSHRDRVFDELTRLGPREIVHGGATGADSTAGDYATVCGVPEYVYKPDWKKYGPAAGPIRNQQMLTENPDLDLVLAFPGGHGTADMVLKARKAGIEVKVVE